MPPIQITPPPTIVATPTINTTIVAVTTAIVTNLSCAIKEEALPWPDPATTLLAIKEPAATKELGMVTSSVDSLSLVIGALAHCRIMLHKQGYKRV